MHKKVVVILLNYNGFADTIECLSSLSVIDSHLYNVLCIDNASTDSSVEKIALWARHRFNVILCPGAATGQNMIGDTQVPPETYVPDLTIVQNSENIGFAAGCNQGITLALEKNAQYVWLLNNDTIVEADSLEILVNYLGQNSSCMVATPQIRLYDKPDCIWNCGGALKWYGARKYYYLYRPVSEIPDREVIDITFVTGCAPLIRGTLLQRMGGFTEKFFFGEEDFEFSLRMKRAKTEMVCCLKSVIYHKVGASIDKTAGFQSFGKIYIYYLNRFIDLREHWPGSIWHAWRLVYVLYIYVLLGKVEGQSINLRYKFIKKLLKDTLVMKGVDKETFESILKAERDYFFQS